jgi:hypothetical protein
LRNLAAAIGSSVAVVVGTCPTAAAVRCIGLALRPRILGTICELVERAGIAADRRKPPSDHDRVPTPRHVEKTAPSHAYGLSEAQFGSAVER